MAPSQPLPLSWVGLSGPASGLGADRSPSVVLGVSSVAAASVRSRPARRNCSSVALRAASSAFLRLLMWDLRGKQALTAGDEPESARPGGVLTTSFSPVTGR